MLNARSKSLVLLTAAAVAVTGLGIEPGFARPAKSSPAVVSDGGQALMPITDFSARRRYYGGYRRNNAAALGAFLAIAGTAAAIAASRRHRHYYGGYGSPYGYYGYQPAPYYGYYGPRYRYW
jgi:hypothetical protein